MRGKWLSGIRQVHTFLGVFFSPLLLLLIATGWWQTFVSDDDKDKGSFNTMMEKFSTIHTDDYYPHGSASHHASTGFKYLIAAMAVSLIITILMGLVLACQNRKRFWLVVIAFVLGILVPSLLLYLT